MTRDEFFNKLEAGAKWDVGVAIARTNPLPLDANSVFKSLDDLTAYATSNPLAYPGQVVSVLGETEIAAYLIKTTGDGAAISKLAASSASGDISADVEALKTQVANIINGTQVVGAATKATQDGEGNVIKDTYVSNGSLATTLTQTLAEYAKLDGAAFTGPVTVQTPTAEANPATKKYVDDAIGGITGFDYQIVESLAALPTTGTKGIIYLVPDEHGAQDIYDEYIWVGDKYEKIGNTDINLTGYVQGTGLTQNTIIVGNDGSNVKTSNYGISVTVTAGDEDNVVTGGAVASFVEGKGYLVSADLADYAKTADVTTSINAAKEELQASIDTKQTAEQVNALIGAAEIQGTQVKGNVAQATLADTATSANKVANALTVGAKTFDGSEAVTIEAADLGALTEVPLATDEAAGGFKTGFTSTATQRAVQLSTEAGKEGQAFVEIPAALTYAAKADGGLELTDNAFGIKALGVTDAMVASVSTDKLIQGAKEFILNGGNA